MKVSKEKILIKKTRKKDLMINAVKIEKSQKIYNKKLLKKML